MSGINKLQVMKKGLIIFVLFGFLSCKKDKVEFQPVQLNFTEIGKGALYGVGAENISESVQVINDDQAWLSLVNKMDSYNSVSPGFNELNVDFNSYTVIALFLDVKPNGWEVEIQTATENELKIELIINEIQYITQDVTQPYHLIKVPKTNKPAVII